MGGGASVRSVFIVTRGRTPSHPSAATPCSVDSSKQLQSTSCSVWGETAPVKWEMCFKMSLLLAIITLQYHCKWTRSSVNMMGCRCFSACRRLCCMSQAAAEARTISELLRCEPVALSWGLKCLDDLTDGVHRGSVTEVGSSDRSSACMLNSADSSSSWKWQDTNLSINREFCKCCIDKTSTIRAKLIRPCSLTLTPVSCGFRPKGSFQFGALSN